jgi:hypothetical protein
LPNGDPEYSICFVFMNLCLVKAFLNYMRGRQTILWERSMREAFE